MIMNIAISNECYPFDFYQYHINQGSDSFLGTPLVE